MNDMRWNYCELCNAEMSARVNYFTWGNELNETSWSVWVCPKCVEKTKAFLSELRRGKIDDRKEVKP